MGNLKLGLIGIVEEEARRDFWGTMQRVANANYLGVEGAEQLLEGDVPTNVKKFHELGLRVLTVSASREQLRDDLDNVVRRAKALESSRVSVWWGPCDSKEQLLRDADLYDVAGEKLASEGLKLCYHNHDHEFRTAFNGVCAFDILAENTHPQHLYFEVDIAWVTFGGADPLHVLRKMNGRVPAIHVKDLVDLSAPAQFTAVGTGIVNIYDSIRTAMESCVEWMVIEQDRLRHLSAFETITVSYLNLKEAGLV